MRRLVIGAVLATVMFAGGAGTAFAHVHAGTPLTQCSIDNAPNAGGNGTDGTPADDDNGGPIGNFIPRDTGNAPFPPGPDAGPGSSAPATPHCP